ncbi:MAG: hypothetical protein SVT52_08705 [Planctomycetota bacterium]|nr:hypothetical protein [Planctomycetota bacterium]
MTPLNITDKTGKTGKKVRGVCAAAGWLPVLLAVFSAGCAVSPPAATDAAPREPGHALEGGPLAEALKLTEKERQILSAVVDRDRQLDETGLYMMLARTAKLPELNAEQFKALDQPDYANLLQRPQHYRGRPIRLPARIYTVKRISPGHGLTPSMWWPPDRPVWILDCLVPAEPPGRTADQPIRVLSIVEPAFCQTSGQAPPEEQTSYNVQAERVDLAGVFYKVYRDKDHQGDDRDFPVVLTWQLTPAGWDLASPLPMPPKIMLIFGGVILLALVYIFLKLHTRKARRIQARTVGESPPAAPRRGDENDSSANVDPLLREAVRRYKEESKNKDAANRNG